MINEYYKNLNIRKYGAGFVSNENQIKCLKELVNNDNLKNIMQIGFNAGHSADIFLGTNKNINLVSFDIGKGPCVKLGEKYIKNTYPNRHKLILGDSKKTLPEYIKNNPDLVFDLIFIDGGHDYITAKSDLMNCKKLSHKDTIVILDDVVKKKEYICKWNLGPNKAWDKAIGNREIKPYIKQLGFEEYCIGKGNSWGKYIFD